MKTRAKFRADRRYPSGKSESAVPLSRGGAAIQVWLTASPVSTKLLWLHCVHPTEDNWSSRRQHLTEVLWEAVSRRGEQTELLRWRGLLGEAQVTLPLQLTQA